MTEETKSATAEPTAAPTNGAQPAQSQQPAELTVQDLVALKQIIDVASQRGAFKPNEMAVVGTTYNKLELFLNAVQQQQQAQQEQEQKAQAEGK